MGIVQPRRSHITVCVAFFSTHKPHSVQPRELELHVIFPSLACVNVWHSHAALRRIIFRVKLFHQVPFHATRNYSNTQ